MHPYTFRRENMFLPVELRPAADPAATATSPPRSEQFLELGVDGFFTDNPDVGRATVDAFSG